MHEAETLEDFAFKVKNNCSTKLSNLWNVVEGRFKQKLNPLQRCSSSRTGLKCTIKNVANCKIKMGTQRFLTC